ncbi:MAG TPA: P1 family peptidase [Spirochaetia bacterium]|nr:P1 family peptidase [Spirochaetia bacterium]
MGGSITDVPGIEVGHALCDEGTSGCTVVMCRSGAVPGVDTRGGAPGTRETDCLRPENVVSTVHAVFLSGGSAYGLDCGAGVMKWLEEHRIGFDVGCAIVPIVAGAVINDLAFSGGKVRPNAQTGYQACRTAVSPQAQQGNVGAGAGASIGKLAGNSKGMVKGGLGTASIRVGDLVVGAIVAVNCIGDVVDPATGEALAGTLSEDRSRIAGAMNLLTDSERGFREGFPTNTTIGVVATNALLSKAMATRVAMMGQDGYARTIIPIHTLSDGDVVFSLATGAVKADVNRVGALAAEAMARAVIGAVRAAESLGGVPCSRELRGGR